MKVIYKGQRRNLRHIDGMISSQYSDYFHLDMNVGDESLVPNIRKRKYKAPKLSFPNSKTKEKWERKANQATRK